MTLSAARSALSIRTKLIFLTVGTTVLALSIVCTAFVLHDRSSYGQAKQRAASVLVSAMAESAVAAMASRDDEAIRRVLDVLQGEPSAELGAIYGRDGRALALWMRPESGVPVPAELVRGEQADGFHEGRLHVTRPIGPESRAGTLHVAFSTRDMHARTVRFIEIAAAALLVSALLALGLAARAQRIITRPVELLSAAARRVRARQDLLVRAERVSADELGQLTDHFNAMLSTLDARDAELEQRSEQLERRLRERTRQLEERTRAFEERDRALRRVLDSVDVGVLTVDHQARIGAEHSAALAAWFGAPVEGAELAAYLDARAPGFGARLEHAWSQLVEGVMPLDLDLAQLPSKLRTPAGRSFEVAYRPIGRRGDTFDELLVIISDVSARVEKERSDAERAELMAMVEHASRDRNGFVDFVEESGAAVRRLANASSADAASETRDMHALGASFGMFGLEHLYALVERMTEDCAERRGPLTAEQRGALEAAWQGAAQRARALLGDGAEAITIERREIEGLLAALLRNEGRDELIRSTTRLLLEPVAPKLARIGERARVLTERAGKARLEVSVQADGVRASGDVTWLWNVLPHLVAERADHALETTEERIAAGKAAVAQLKLVAAERDSALVVHVEDDGRGIDWQQVRSKARALGLPCDTEDDLSRALFADEPSANETSPTALPRASLSEVAAACQEHGARIRVTSERGRGTIFAIALPQPVRVRSGLRQRTAAVSDGIARASHR